MNPTLCIAVLALADSLGAPSPAPLDLGYRSMYDFQFDTAHRAFQEWSAQHPDDPMGPVSDAAAYLFSELNRLHILEAEFFVNDDRFVNRAKPSPDVHVKEKFEADLARAQQLVDRALARDPNNANAQFAAMMRLGLKSDYEALIEKRYMSSLSDIKTSRAIGDKLLASNPDFGDAYLAAGIENYLLSLKPAPLRWLLRLGGAETDRDRGLSNLAIVAQRGHYLAPYARILLSVAALRDHNVPRAKELLAGLARDFPHNPLYVRELERLH